MIATLAKILVPVAIVAAAFVSANAQTSASRAESVSKSSDGAVRVVEVVGGLDSPWGMAFLPDGRVIVTEKGGTMRLVSNSGGLSKPIEGLPSVHAQGQGGLLDVTLSPEFETDRRIFFSYAEPTPNGARTAVASAVLDADSLKLNALQHVFAQKDDPPGGHHFGSRLVFGEDGTLFITLGDRNTMRERSQALDSHLGKIVRVNPDGSIPDDNPFVDTEGALPEIWSYGHRNVQGAALHPETGVLWINDHGPRGGDEVNIIKRGANYGWPEVTRGRDYGSGEPFGDAIERDDVEAPIHYWVPTSIAPSGMAFYTGDAIPQWKGDVFIGALADRMLVRLELDGGEIKREEQLLGELGNRIRAVASGPDGKLYVLEESEGRLLRLEPQ